jgi:hypothetical protein
MTIRRGKPKISDKNLQNSLRPRWMQENVWFSFLLEAGRVRLIEKIQ